MSRLHAREWRVRGRSGSLHAQQEAQADAVHSDWSSRAKELSNDIRHQVFFEEKGLKKAGS